MFSCPICNVDLSEAEHLTPCLELQRTDERWRAALVRVAELEAKLQEISLIVQRSYHSGEMREDIQAVIESSPGANMTREKQPIDTLGGMLDRIQEVRDRGKSKTDRQCPSTFTSFTSGGTNMRTAGEKPGLVEESALRVAGKRPEEKASEAGIAPATGAERGSMIGIGNIDALGGGPADEGSGGPRGSRNGVEPEAACVPRPSDASDAPDGAWRQLP